MDLDEDNEQNRKDLNNIKEIFLNLNPLASVIDLNREYQRVGESKDRLGHPAMPEIPGNIFFRLDFCPWI